MVVVILPSTDYELGRVLGWCHRNQVPYQGLGSGRYRVAVPDDLVSSYMAEFT